MSGILRLESLTKGNTLKQGDKTPLKYRLFDADGEKLNIAGKSATVRLVYPDFLTIGYEKGGLTVAQDDTVTFTIDNVIPSRIYHVEIIVDDKFIFPSRADESKFTVDKSSLGTESNIVEIVGVDAVVRKAVDLINQDPSLIIDEDKLVSDIISDTGIGSINDYYKAFDDLKPKAEQSITKSAEALTKSQNALNVANGIDAKATNALSLSESADTLSKSVQEQFNQVVINGDSSVEAAQARIDASGQVNTTLKERLDKEYNEVTTRLIETKKYTVEKLVEDNGSHSMENIPVTNNFTLSGVQRNLSQVNAKSSTSTIFLVDANVYKISDFTSWGVNRSSKFLVASSGSKNTRGMINNLLINGHDEAIVYEGSYMNSIINCLFQNINTAITIKKDSFSNIISDNAFLASRVALDISGTNGTTATNTLRFLNNTIEVYNVAIKNKTELFIIRCYIGDNKGSSYDSTLEVDQVVDVYEGSTTYVEDSWLGLVAVDNEAKGAVKGDKNFISAVANFNTSDAKVPTTVSIKGGDIMLSSQNSGTGVRQGYVYNSRSNLDRVILDKVKLRLSTGNTLHNNIPYLLEEGYSPLYSNSPMNNYVINGTFTDSTITDYYLNSPWNVHCVTTKVPDVTNQYGGDVIRWDATGTWGDNVGMAFRYRIPKHLIGKPMVLEVYSPNTTMFGSETAVKFNGGIHSDLEEITGRNYTKINCAHENVRIGSRTPYRNVMIVKPTKENGIIRIEKNFANPAGVFSEISSITLSELDNYLYLGKYVDYTHSEMIKCTTSERPEMPIINEQIYDTTLSKPIWWDGMSWKDAVGSEV